MRLAHRYRYATSTSGRSEFWLVIKLTSNAHLSDSSLPIFAFIQLLTFSRLGVLTVLAQIANETDSFSKYVLKDWQVLYGITLVSSGSLAILGLIRLGIAQFHSCVRPKAPSVQDLETSDSTPLHISDNDTIRPPIDYLYLACAIVALAGTAAAMSFGPWSPFTGDHLQQTWSVWHMIAMFLIAIAAGLVVGLSIAFTGVIESWITTRKWPSTKDGWTQVGLFTYLGFIIHSFIFFFAVVVNLDSFSIPRMALQSIFFFLMLESSILALVGVGKIIHRSLCAFSAQRSSTGHLAEPVKDEDLSNTVV